MLSGQELGEDEDELLEELAELQNEQQQKLEQTEISKDRIELELPNVPSNEPELFPSVAEEDRRIALTE